MTEADITVTRYIQRNALEWLARTQGGLPWHWQPRLTGYPAHILRHDPGGSFIAEVDGLPVGFSQSFVRGHIWFLSQLFVQPEAHGLDIGRLLLDRAVEYAREQGARIVSVVASPSFVAQALYMRAGMFARGIGYRMSGDPRSLLALPEPGANRKRIVDCSGWTERIGALTREVFGDSRLQDHEFWLSGNATRAGNTSLGLVRGGDFLGYAYVDRGGGIGPIAAYDAADQLPLLRMAGEWLVELGVEEGFMWAISLNPTVMRALLDCGWRVDGATFFMTSEPFGDFTRYAPSGGLML